MQSTILEFHAPFSDMLHSHAITIHLHWLAVNFNAGKMLHP